MALSMDSRPNIYTIGHSNHPLEAFLELLKGNSIDVVVDTRTQPYSAYSPHFTRRPLEDSLVATGIKYLFLGKELGGRPEGSEFYDDDGRVLYCLLAESPLFLAGVARVENGMANYRIVLLCSKEDPQVCHRQLLVGRVLSRRGVVIHHIRGDGRVETVTPEAAAAKRAQTFFSFGEDNSWKSLRSALQKRSHSDAITLNVDCSPSCDVVGERRV